MVLAMNATQEPLFCFWDEPDNYIALNEVGHFVMALRSSYQSQGQFLATSHNEETIEHFGRENTLYVYRNSHQNPTRSRWADELDIAGDFVNALILDDIEP